MSPKLLRNLWLAELAAAAVFVAACGSNPPLSTTAPPSSPGSANNLAASGPILSAWWDADRKGLRAIYGVLGAAQQGPPTYEDGTFSNAAVCARKSIALLMTPSGAISLAKLPNGRPVAIANSGLSRATIVFSPSCAISLAFVPGGSKALLVRGLLSVPKVSQVALPAGVSAAAIADTGAILVDVPGSQGSAAIKSLAGTGANVQPVTLLSRFGGMAFLPGMDSAVVADAAANAVFEASHLAGNLSVEQIAGESDGVAEPAAIAASADGRWVAVANSKGSSVLRLDLTGQTAPLPTACHCSPGELEPLAGNFAFRLTEPGSGTVWAFDGNGSAPRVVFLPSEQPATAAQGARP